MQRTIEAVLEANGTVRLLEPIDLPGPCRVLVTIPDKESATDRPTTKSRWARAAEFFASDRAGHLDGMSEQAREYLQDFRDGFQLRS